MCEDLIFDSLIFKFGMENSKKQEIQIKSQLKLWPEECSEGRLTCEKKVLRNSWKYQ